MDKLKCMEVLVSVVESGNFTSAGHKLGVTTVMVGRQIRQLEVLLGTSLLKRNTRKQSLTHAGALFYQSAKVILDNVTRAQEAIQEMSVEPRGTLRIGTPVAMGSSIIAPLVAQYQQRFPQVAIELRVSNTMANLIEEEVDLVVGIGALSDSGLIARPLRPYKIRLCGSPDYLARAGVPMTWEDLTRHRCLVHSAWHPEWMAQDGRTLAWPNNAAFSSNDGYVLRAAAIAGAGLILQPEQMLADAIATGELVVVLDGFVPPALAAHLLYLQDSFPRSRLTSLIDFLMQELG